MSILLPNFREDALSFCLTQHLPLEDAPTIEMAMSQGASKMLDGVIANFAENLEGLKSDRIAANKPNK